jgi:hypothetical protein
MSSKDINWKMVTRLVLFALGAILAGGLVGISLQYVPTEIVVPEIILTIILLAGTIAFIAILNITVAIFAALGLSTPEHSFGLPGGTIRAVIALSLILIFIISSLFLFSQLKSTTKVEVPGLTEEQVEEIPGDEILAKKPNETDSTLFDVDRLIKNNETSEDFAQQILTTVSTLVVAVSGFYFGSRATSTARKDEIRPTLKLVSPATHKVQLKTDDENVPIHLETSPPGLAIEAKIDGVKFEGTGFEPLKQIRYNEFEFELPMHSEKRSVELVFSLTAYPEVTVDLTVEAPAREIINTSNDPDMGE